MQSNAVERVYIDANVWFSYITKGNYDRKYNITADIINNATNNKIAIISRLVILEVINTIRKRIAEREPFVGLLKNNEDVRNIIKSKIDYCIKEFIDKITKWESTGKLLIVDSQTPISDVFNTTFLMLYGLFGEITDSRRCRICKNAHDSYSYKGIDHFDIQHALMAKESLTTEFVTFDVGYEQLRPHFPEFSINIL